MDAPGSLHTLSDVARRYHLEPWQVSRLRDALNGKAATIDAEGRVLYRWCDIERVLPVQRAA